MIGGILEEFYGGALPRGSGARGGGPRSTAGSSLALRPTGPTANAPATQRGGLRTQHVQPDARGCDGRFLGRRPAALGPTSTVRVSAAGGPPSGWARVAPGFATSAKVATSATSARCGRCALWPPSAAIAASARRCGPPWRRPTGRRSARRRRGRSGGRRSRRASGRPARAGRPLVRAKAMVTGRSAGAATSTSPSIPAAARTGRPGTGRPRHRPGEPSPAAAGRSTLEVVAVAVGQRGRVEIPDEGERQPSIRSGHPSSLIRHRATAVADASTCVPSGAPRIARAKTSA